MNTVLHTNKLLSRGARLVVDGASFSPRDLSEFFAPAREWASRPFFGLCFSLTMISERKASALYRWSANVAQHFPRVHEKFFVHVFETLFCIISSFNFTTSASLLGTWKKKSHTMQISIVKGLIGRDVCLMVGTFTLFLLKRTILSLKKLRNSRYEKLRL